MSFVCIFFFFQAEDGIRDLIVTGVQTCALPISSRRRHTRSDRDWRDRKSTRLNSSHDQISYAVFCLKKKEHTSELQSRSDIVCRLLLEITKPMIYTEKMPPSLLPSIERKFSLMSPINFSIP